MKTVSAKGLHFVDKGEGAGELHLKGCVCLLFPHLFVMHLAWSIRVLTALLLCTGLCEWKYLHTCGLVKYTHYNIHLH